MACEKNRIEFLSRWKSISPKILLKFEFVVVFFGCILHVKSFLMMGILSRTCEKTHNIFLKEWLILVSCSQSNNNVTTFKQTYHSFSNTSEFCVGGISPSANRTVNILMSTRVCALRSWPSSGCLWIQLGVLLHLPLQARRGLSDHHARCSHPWRIPGYLPTTTRDSWLKVTAGNYWKVGKNEAFRNGRSVLFIDEMLKDSDYIECSICFELLQEQKHLL